tara:strand:- start:74 stop:613 length:540 start_codon:yes stop_codon:yes gene_type:complete
MSLSSLVDKPLMQNPLAGGSFTPTGLGNLSITAPGQIPERYKEGFEEFYKQNPESFKRIGGQAMSFVTTPQGERIQFFGTSGADNFRRYLESIGETPRNDALSPVQESGPLATMPTQEEGIPGLSGSNVPLPGNQSLMDRLTSLEQGIGSLQNQIASLFQMGQASDPFGLGGFMNQRRF